MGGDDPFSFGDVVYGAGGTSLPEPVSEPTFGAQVPTEGLSWASGPATVAAATTPGLRIAGPPFRWLWACATTAAIAVAGTAVMGARPMFAVATWVISGPVAFWLLGRFSTGDAVAQASPVYQRPSWAQAAYGAVVGLALLAIVGCAVRVGLWLGHL